MQYPSTSAAAAVTGASFKAEPIKAAQSPQSPTMPGQSNSKRRGVGGGPTPIHNAAGVKSGSSSPATLSHKASGGSSAFTSTSSSTLSLRTPEQVHADLLYLQQHRVCETLEFIVKMLLRDQPEDPILNICNMLRESNRSDSSVRVSVSNQSRLDAINGATPPGAVRGTSGQRVLDLSRERGTKQDTVGGVKSGTHSDKSEDSVRHDTEDQSTNNHEEDVAPLGADKGRAQTNMCLFPEDAPAQGSIPATPITDGSGRGWAGVVKDLPSATSADTTLPAALGGTYPRNLNGSVNSRITTPASSTAGGARWLADTLQQTVNAQGTFPQVPPRGGAPRIERDESSRSDGSLFSVASVDMTEFLAEFRGAHQVLYGESQRGYISIQDLADIVDAITIPLPDVRLLVDLFNELGERDPDVAAEKQVVASEVAPDAAGGDEAGPGLVCWETFLARMNFRIQGRYPQETLRAAFASLLPAAVPATPVSVAGSDVRRGSQRLGGGVGGRPPLAAQASVGSNLDNYFASQAANDTASALSNSYTAAGGQGVQPLNLTSLRAPTVVTSAESISTIALWEGLGIQHRMSDLLAALRALHVKTAPPSSPVGPSPTHTGSPPRARDLPDQYQLHVTDFIRLVHRLQSL